MKKRLTGEQYLEMYYDLWRKECRYKNYISGCRQGIVLSSVADLTQQEKELYAKLDSIFETCTVKATVEKDGYHFTEKIKGGEREKSIERILKEYPQFKTAKEINEFIYPKYSDKAKAVRIKLFNEFANNC
jgi:hypothetical protein